MPASLPKILEQYPTLCTKPWYQLLTVEHKGRTRDIVLSGTYPFSPAGPKLSNIPKFPSGHADTKPTEENMFGMWRAQRNYADHLLSKSHKNVNDDRIHDLADAALDELDAIEKIYDVGVLQSAGKNKGLKSTYPLTDPLRQEVFDHMMDAGQLLFCAMYGVTLGELSEEVKIYGPTVRPATMQPVITSATYQPPVITATIKEIKDFGSPPATTEPQSGFQESWLPIVAVAGVLVVGGGIAAFLLLRKKPRKANRKKNGPLTFWAGLVA